MKSNFLEHNKFLWRFAGEDPFILSECTKKTRVRFSIIGLFVIVIMLISGLSISYGVYEVLESYYFGLPIGIYFAFVVLILYLFILHSSTKNVLPTKENSLYGRMSSFVIRVGFLAFLGFLVSQPIEYKLFSNQIDELLQVDINNTITEKNKKLNKEFVLKLNEIQIQNYSETELYQEIEKFRIEKDNELKKFMNYQYSRNFFIKKMILMDSSSKTWYIWVFSSLFVLFFIYPVILKSKVGLQSNYYKHKKQIQENIIIKHHHNFVNSYDEVLNNKFKELNLKWETKFQDPPFNTIKKKGIEFETDSEFSKWLLNESN